MQKKGIEDGLSKLADKYIKTEYTDDIYRGIRVIYKNKMYDYSLSERNV